MELTTYITFKGNAGEAIEFYKNALGADLKVTKVSETPMAEQMPDMKDKIMHSELRKNAKLLLFASDMFGEGEPNFGNVLGVCLTCDSEEEITTAFKNISEGANVTHELKTEFWGDTYGDLIDKFGVRWMFNYSKPKENA